MLNKSDVYSVYIYTEISTSGRNLRLSCETFGVFDLPCALVPRGAEVTNYLSLSCAGAFIFL